MGIDVAKSNDFHNQPGLFDIAEPLTADADPGNADAVVRSVNSIQRDRQAAEQITESPGRPELKFGDG